MLSGFCLQMQESKDRLGQTSSIEKMIASTTWTLFLVWVISPVHAFLPRKISAREFSPPSLDVLARPTSCSQVSIESYDHDGWNLTYRYKPASPGYEKASPLLLIHPVGIGLSSWFWEPLLEEWIGPAVYAPNLIGCGVSEGSHAWDPDERGLSFPLGWVQGCEALMKMATQKASLSSFKNNIQQWTIVSQGGLAPAGVMLAARNPDFVSKLVLASPPTWKDMTTPIPESELARNYNFLKSPVLGKLAFNILESREAIGFFSNLFLFSEPCDSAWLDNAVRELGAKTRPPVMAFNAGFCQHRSFEEELRTLDQPTLILAGKDDKRQIQEYSQFMKNCRVERLPGLNVLPWESTSEVAKKLMS
jgi:pimeloyl-ACP methyl ester carboxylesterase